MKNLAEIHALVDALSLTDEEEDGDTYLKIAFIDHEVLDNFVLKVLQKEAKNFYIGQQILITLSEKEE
jgi:hypothetical protein